MPYLAKLTEIKEKTHLTNAEIARLSNIPLATITRIFNGSTPNPTFETFAQIAIALGASLDEIVGLKPSEAQPVSSPIAKTLDSYSDLLQAKDERIRELKEENERLRKEKRTSGTAFIITVCLVFLILFCDALCGHFGYFRY